MKMIKSIDYLCKEYGTNINSFDIAVFSRYGMFVKHGTP